MQFSKQLVQNVLSENHISITGTTRFVMHGHTPNVIYLEYCVRRVSVLSNILHHVGICKKALLGHTEVTQSVRWIQIPTSIK